MGLMLPPGLAPLDLPENGPEPFPGYGVPGTLRWCLNRARDYLQPEQMAKVGPEIALSRAKTAFDFIQQALGVESEDMEALHY